jgi:hypothetical protein
VWDLAGDLFEQRTCQERKFTRNWWRGFRKGQIEELLVRVGTAKKHRELK